MQITHFTFRRSLTTVKVPFQYNYICFIFILALFLAHWLAVAHSFDMKNYKHNTTPIKTVPTQEDFRVFIGLLACGRFHAQEKLSTSCLPKWKSACKTRIWCKTNWKSSERMFHDQKQTFCTHQQYVWHKKARLISRKPCLIIKQGGKLVIGVLCCYRKWNSWLYEGHYGFFEVSGLFGKNCEAFSAFIDAWWLMDLPAGQHPNVYKSTEASLKGSIVECTWVTCSVFKFKPH